MIKIEVKKDKITIKGHSGYSEEGSDIVCSAVSSIAITTVNAILAIDDKAISFKEDDGYLEINILKHTDVIDKLIYNMVDLLEDLENQYTEFIKIK